VTNPNGYQRLVDFLEMVRKAEGRNNFPAIKAFNNAHKAKFGQFGYARQNWEAFDRAQATRNQDYVLPECMIRYLDLREPELRKQIAAPEKQKSPLPTRVTSGRVLRDVR
jgi:hypothetical protein